MRGRDRAKAGRDVPAPASIATKFSSGGVSAEVALGVFPEKPGQELGELVSAGNVFAFACAGCATVCAAPTLRARGVPPVFDELGVA